MNIAKNMEVIFVIAIALACVTGVATAAVPAHHAAQAGAVQASAQAKIQVVKISAKRLTAVQKAAL